MTRDEFLATARDLAQSVGLIATAGITNPGDPAVLVKIGPPNGFGAAWLVTSDDELAQTVDGVALCNARAVDAVGACAAASVQADLALQVGVTVVDGVAVTAPGVALPPITKGVL